jgi:dipeptide/tripeptide permease
MIKKYNTELKIDLLSISNQMNENKTKPIEEETKYQIVGWILFTICAILFIASSLKNHDTLTLVGSVIFLIACIVFLIPIFKAHKTTGDDKN